MPAPPFLRPPAPGAAALVILSAAKNLVSVGPRRDLSAAKRTWGAARPAAAIVILSVAKNLVSVGHKTRLFAALRVTRE